MNRKPSRHLSPEELTSILDATKWRVDWQADGRYRLHSCFASVEDMVAGTAYPTMVTELGLWSAIVIVDDQARVGGEMTLTIPRSVGSDIRARCRVTTIRESGYGRPVAELQFERIETGETVEEGAESRTP